MLRVLKKAEDDSRHIPSVQQAGAESLRARHESDVSGRTRSFSDRGGDLRLVAESNLLICSDQLPNLSL